MMDSRCFHRRPRRRTSRAAASRREDAATERARCLYARRTLGGDHDHRDSDRVALACGSSGARGGKANTMPEQPQTTQPRHARPRTAPQFLAVERLGLLVGRRSRPRRGPRTAGGLDLFHPSVPGPVAPLSTRQRQPAGPLDQQPTCRCGPDAKHAAERFQLSHAPQNDALSHHRLLGRRRMASLRIERGAIRRPQRLRRLYRRQRIPSMSIRSRRSAFGENLRVARPRKQCLRPALRRVVSRQRHLLPAEPGDHGPDYRRRQSARTCWARSTSRPTITTTGWTMETTKACSPGPTTTPVAARITILRSLRQIRPTTRRWRTRRAFGIPIDLAAPMPTAVSCPFATARSK